MITIPRTSGIYQWLCIPSGKVYIGSAVNLYLRRCDHLVQLRGNRHVNKILQNAWNKYGESAFDFRVIELVLASFLLEREQYWLDKIKPYLRGKGFNICRVAGSTYGVKLSEETKQLLSRIKTGTKASAEARQQMSDQRKGRPYSDHARIARSVSQKGKAPSENTRLAQIEAESMLWLVTEPSGAQYPIRNLSKFCREHGLDRATAHRVARGKARSHKGWKFQHFHNDDAD